MMKMFFLVAIFFSITAATGLGFAGEQQSCRDWAEGLFELTGALSEQVELERDDLQYVLLRLDELAGESCTSGGQNDIEEITMVAARVSDEICAAENATSAERVLSRAILNQVSKK